MRYTPNYLLELYEDSDAPDLEAGYNKAVTAIDGKLLTLAQDVSTKAQNSHASASTTHGLGSYGAYGHVKLIDTMDSTLDEGMGTAATPKLVYNATRTAVTHIFSADNRSFSMTGGSGTCSMTIQYNSLANLCILQAMYKITVTAKGSGTALLHVMPGAYAPSKGAIATATYTGGGNESCVFVQSTGQVQIFHTPGAAWTSGANLFASMSWHPGQRGI